MKDKKLLEKYNEIWEKFSNIIKKINSELICNKKYLKAEKKSYNEKINTKECSQCIYLSVILVDSVYIKDKSYHPQVFLEKYKHVVRRKKRSYFITDDIEIYSDDSDNSDEKTQIKAIKYINLFLKETRII